VYAVQLEDDDGGGARKGAAADGGPHRLLHLSARPINWRIFVFLLRRLGSCASQARTCGWATPR
jgi:hypothetical protein